MVFLARRESHFQMHIRLKILWVFAAFALSACTNFGFPGVYRIEIQQGNIIDEEDVRELRIGMTMSQVRYLMGSPLIADPFHQHRWDYFYSHRDGEGNSKQKQLSLVFKGELLKSIDESESLEYDEETLEDTGGTGDTGEE